MQKLRVGVIFGGRSAEKEVSLNSGRHVFTILDRSRFDPIAIFMDGQGRLWNIPLPLVLQNTTADIEARLSEAARVPYEQLKEKIDVAFLTTFGKYGEDGCLQGLLELLGIPYTGSGVLGAALGSDKAMQRVLMAENPRINVPTYLVLREHEIRPERSRGTTNDAPRSFDKLRMTKKIVVKPMREGSTIGVTVVKKPEELEAALETAFQYDTAALVEPYLVGLEFSCVVLDGDPAQALLPTETVHDGEIFTYRDKYMPGGSQKITPARLPEEKLKEVQTMCVETFQTLGFRGYARIDGFVLNEPIDLGNFKSPSPPEADPPSAETSLREYKNGTVLITDPNVFSGMAPSSWTFHQAASAGMTPTELLTKIIDFAIQRDPSTSSG